MQNPVPAPPAGEANGVRRHVFCRRYSVCLDMAVQKGWKGFSCLECRGFQKGERIIDEWLQDMEACGLLLGVIFGNRCMPL